MIREERGFGMVKKTTKTSRKYANGELVVLVPVRGRLPDLDDNVYG